MFDRRAPPPAKAGYSRVFSIPILQRSELGRPEGRSPMAVRKRLSSLSRRFWLAWPVVLFPALTACGDGGKADPDPEPPRADSLALAPDSLSFVALADTLRIQATVLDQYGDPMGGVMVLWASDNPAVAKVDQTGLVTSVGNGQTQIRAQAAAERASLKVTITQEPYELEALEGDNQRNWTGFPLRTPLRVRLKDRAGTSFVNAEVTWEVLQGGGVIVPSAARTDLKGEVTAEWILGEGESGPQKVSASAFELDPVEFDATGSAPITLLTTPPLTALMLDTLTARLMVRDSLGVPEDGIPVNYLNVTGFGEIVQGPTTTDVNGELEVNWALGPTPGPQRVTVVRTDIGSSLELVATATGTLDPWPFTMVSPGLFHTCALQTDNAAYCWGRNLESQLALEDTLPVVYPTPVPTGLSWAGIDSGQEHTCGLTSPGGTAYCWGTGFATGQDGDGTQIAEDPTNVPGGPWTALTSGAYHVCARKDDGTAWCWGVGEYGQLGGGAPDTTAAPVQVIGGRTWTRLSAGHFHTCGTTPENQAFCWGRGEEGQLGNGGIVNTNSPVLVAGGNSWSKISAGRFHTCGISASGDAFCWGEGGFNQLGNGSVADQTSPVKVSGGHKWTEITAGQWHSCGVDVNGKLYCWGRGNGFIGLGQFGSSTPAVVLPAYIWRTVRTQGLHTCAITLGWETYCWGPNDWGQLGFGRTEDSGVPRILVRGVFQD